MGNLQMMQLGVDIAKAKFDVALWREGKFKTKVFSNDAAGFAAFESWLKERDATGVDICMEATNVYWEALACHLHDAGHRVSVINPAQIQAFRGATLTRSKTDKIDARLIAQFAASQATVVWTPPAKELRALIALVRDLQYLKDAYQEERNRLGTAHAEVALRIERHLAYLQEEIKQAQRRISDHIDRHPGLKESKALLSSIPGVGENTAPWLLSLLGDGERFDNGKQVAAFIGLDPQHCQSGSSVKGRSRISKSGHADIRRAMYMPALVAFSKSSAYQPFVSRLKAAGKPPKLIIVALMRKLVTIAWAVLKYRKPFDPTLHSA